MDRVACPVCEASESKIIGDYIATSDLLSGYYLSVCQSCDFTFLSPELSSSAWDEYNSKYFLSAHGGVNRAPITLAFHEGIAKIRLAHIKREIGLSKLSLSRVLEIGPGMGHFADAFLKASPNVDYYAVESDSSVWPELVKKGIKVIPADAAHSVTGGFDLVVISHVLEHTLKPVNSLKAMTKFLNIGGLLFVEVPCRDQDYKKQHEPHVSFFSKVALETLAARAKFTDVKVSFHGDTLSDIKKYDFSRRVIIKLLNITGLDLIPPFGPNKNQVAEFDLTRLQQLALSHSRPFVDQTQQSRWLRMTARKG